MPRPTTPPIAADLIIELLDQPGRPVVLIERRNPPHGWALPGGFVEVGESLERAAVREALEETGLEVRLKTLLGMYSDPARDPRGHTVTAVYIGEAHGTPEGGDDAAKAMAFRPPASAAARIRSRHSLGGLPALPRDGDVGSLAGMSDVSFLDFVLEQLADARGLKVRAMFGGHGRAALLRAPVQESTGRAAGVAGCEAGQVAKPPRILALRGSRHHRHG